MANKILRAAVLRSTDVDPEPRTERAINSLLGIGFNVVLFNWKRTKFLNGKKKNDYERITLTRSAVYGGVRGNLIHQLEWQLWLGWKLLTNNFDLVYACDADTGLTATFIGKFKNYKIVYDQFDPITSRFNSKSISAVAMSIEKYIMRKAHLSVVASESRKHNSFENQIVVSNNNYNLSRQSNKKTNKILSICYFGILQRDRGLGELVECVNSLSQVKLSIAGFGPMSNEIANLQSSNIVFLGKVNYEEGMDFIREADISYVMYNPNYEHNRSTASGKFFDSIMVGTPCIVAKGTKLAEFVNEFNLGWSIDYGDSRVFSQLLDSIVSKRDSVIENFEENREAFLKSIEMSKEKCALTDAVVRFFKEEM